MALAAGHTALQMAYQAGDLDHLELVVMEGFDEELGGLAVHDEVSPQNCAPKS